MPPATWSMGWATTITPSARCWSAAPPSRAARARRCARSPAPSSSRWWRGCCCSTASALSGNTSPSASSCSASSCCRPWARSAEPMLRWLQTPSVRPFVLLAVIVMALAFVDLGQNRFWNPATAFSVLQQFATIGPVALALGLSMIVREFDLSVGGMLSLAGCLAVMTGAGSPALGVAIAVLAGCLSGLIQGGIMVWLGLSSVGVTLGGLLTLGGLTYVLTGNATIGYDRMDVAMLVNQPLYGVFSLRN